MPKEPNVSQFVTWLTLKYHKKLEYVAASMGESKSQCLRNMIDFFEARFIRQAKRIERKEKHDITTK